MSAKNYFYFSNTSKSIEVTIDFDDFKTKIDITNSDDTENLVSQWNLNDLNVEFYSNYCIVINNATNDSLYINNSQDLIQFKSIYKKNGFVNRLFDSSFISKISIGLGSLATLLICYIYLLPVLSDFIIKQLPISYDKEIGSIAFDNLYYKESENFEKSKQLNQFYKILKKEDYSRDIEFIVLDQEVFNAYALPDGKVFIYQEMIDSIANPSELISLIGHEVAHVNNRHSMRMIGKNVSSYILISLILSDANGFIALMAENASRIYNLKYSREFEQEADMHALNLMKLNNADMQASESLFKKLKSKSNQYDLPEFITTHPNIDERIKTVTAYKNKLPVILRPGVTYYFNKIKE